MFRPNPSARRARPVHPDSTLRTQAQLDTDAQIRAQLLRQASLHGALAAHQATRHMLDQIAFLEPATDAMIREAFGTHLGRYEDPRTGGRA
jgi:hypothetical protein